MQFWRGNYFVLAGLHVSRPVVAEVNPRIDEVKRRFFGTKHVEIKSVWMRNPQKRKKRYLEPYGITPGALREFSEEWYRVFSDYPQGIQIQAFVLDKRYYRNKREDFTPLQILTQVLFDRVEMHPTRECHVVFDQMEEQITSTKFDHGEMLKISNREVNLGSFHEKYTHASTRFEKSSKSNFLQLADTVAYNVYRQFVDHGDAWESGYPSELATYPFFERLAQNFYHKDGRVAGIGVVKLPDPGKRPWRVPQKRA